MPRINKIDYASQPISFYKFCCKTDNVESCYVGHTANFTIRKHAHKSACNNVKSKNHNFLIYQTIREHGGWDNWNMIEISSKICESKRHSEKIEQSYIDELNSNMNMRRAIRTKEELSEYQKQYKLDNKETLLEKAKQYRLDNKDTLSEKHKQYYIENKETIVEKVKQYNLDNKETILEKAKQYKLDNKETISNQKKQIITCECGCKIRYDNIATHRKTNKHKKLICLN